jgi:hypothetical protein
MIRCWWKRRYPYGGPVEIVRDRDPDGCQFSHVSWGIAITLGRFQVQFMRADW